MFNLTPFCSLGIAYAYQKDKRYFSKEINHSIFENKFSEFGKVEGIFLELIVLDLEFPCLSYFSNLRFSYFTDDCFSVGGISGDVSITHVY